MSKGVPPEEEKPEPTDMQEIQLQMNATTDEVGVAVVERLGCSCGWNSCSCKVGKVVVVCLGCGCGSGWGWESCGCKVVVW